MEKQFHALLMRRYLRCSALLLALLAVTFFPENFSTKSVVIMAMQQNSNTINKHKVWLTIEEGGRELKISDGYDLTLNGGGKLNFKEGGRVIELPEGLTVLVNNKEVSTERKVHEGETVRIVNDKREILWKLAPTQAESPSPFSRPPFIRP